MNDNKTVVLGRVSGLFGVKGWVKVHSYTEPREAILEYPEWFVGTPAESLPVKVAEGKRHGKTVIVRFVDVVDRDVAASYLDSEVRVLRAALPEMGNDEYYWADLEGLTVVKQDGAVLGKVAYLLETGANDVLVVQGDQEILIPYVKEQVIEHVDLDNKVIRVNWEWS